MRRYLLSRYHQGSSLTLEVAASPTGGTRRLCAPSGFNSRNNHATTTAETHDYGDNKESTQQKTSSTVYTSPPRVPQPLVQPLRPRVVNVDVQPELLKPPQGSQPLRISNHGCCHAAPPRLRNHRHAVEGFVQRMESLIEDEGIVNISQVCVGVCSGCGRDARAARRYRRFESRRAEFRGSKVLVKASR